MPWASRASVVALAGAMSTGELGLSLAEMIRHTWPGNIRELKNTIESAAVIAENGYIEPAQLPSRIAGGFGPGAAAHKLPSNLSLDDRLQEIERSIIVEALTKTGGVQTRATELLGINQRSLWHRIKKLNIDVKGIKNIEM